MASEAPNTTTRAPRVTMKIKLERICTLLDELNLNPKTFMTAFLEDDDEVSAVRRRYYGTERGWESTLDLILSIKALTCLHMGGRALWHDFILSEATEIVCAQKPQSGLAPRGSYYNSTTLSDAFFSKEQLSARNDSLVQRMPFLYQLLCVKMKKNDIVAPVVPGADPLGNLANDESDEDEGVGSDKELPEVDGSVFRQCRDRAVRRANRVTTIARTICAMVAFGSNRRHNGLQLSNSLIFLAAGVTERVSAYLNYVGLASSRRTAHEALKSLGKESANRLMARFDLSSSKRLAPFLCYNNLDFQEKIHMKSVGRASTMFHGTWGYIHSAPEALMKQVDPAELSVEAFNNALHAGTQLTIRPEMFTPTRDSTIHWEKTLKSQITRVIVQYLARPKDTRVKLNKSPPPAHPIVPEDPQIAVLKLMVASDNSAQGVGDVFTGVIQQSGLTPEDHDNILAIPGAAHTLWNISQAVFLAHWGNEKHARDTGAWRTLHALGVQADKPVTKKDFNMMLCHIEKVHEASLLFCVLLVANRSHVPLTADLLKVSSETITEWVEQTYDRFCSGEAFRTDLARTSPAHLNLLLRIRDFATIIEAQRSMKEGDYGRLMFMWERWAVMTQGLGHMPHYSKHLPKLIVQLKYVLPKSISHLISNTLLLSPKGQAGHFMATNQYLEVLNYWLKYFFNHSGIGTNINRLKDVFSPNITILKSLLDILKLESGCTVVHQSHHNRITWDSLNNFRRMAERERMGLSPPKGPPPQQNLDTYSAGILKLQAEFTRNGLERFRPYCPGIKTMSDSQIGGMGGDQLQEDGLLHEAGCSDESSAEVSDHDDQE
ncbi:uncharacterized protein PGTG_11176 [Puccinia graminis f. sp. tritici CRL 75-36-700-3]|uniref:DUF6589 domain-containing protein n=1 Tax=Puccinia graminis f. sp. tritici (strain CRL 75-36-700-3 / race SCCL) TaxID=418459 RepID=E3KL32_PUCGT|nr:uncharacterized protein PGTG_11176 [Puccinia graminis f. sp. tritici CRL 75-36-700-3]EFP85007.2 hypothetical protein PGTG_11176 [Puccinia graminis f. sp. tritici CRL 75-36-700-3]